MKITVSQSPYVGTGLGESRLLPEHITKNVSFAYRKSTALLPLTALFSSKIYKNKHLIQAVKFLLFLYSGKKTVGKKKINFEIFN